MTDIGRIFLSAKSTKDKKMLHEIEQQIVWTFRKVIGKLPLRSKLGSLQDACLPLFQDKMAPIPVDSIVTDTAANPIREFPEFWIKRGDDIQPIKIVRILGYSRLVTLPASAVAEQPHPHVFKVDDGYLRRHFVVCTYNDPLLKTVEVSGLHHDDLVIPELFPDMMDGTPVFSRLEI